MKGYGYTCWQASMVKLQSDVNGSFIFIYILCAFLFRLHVRVLGPLELELQTVVRHHVGAGN